MAGGLDNDRFATISAISGIDVDDDGRALAQVDWDHDGDLDLWISNRNAPRLRFFRNESSRTNRFVQLRLVGNGRDTNRDGVGARVTVVLKSASEPIRLIKTLHAGEGFLSQSSQWLHFGLGDATEIESIFVSWPNKESKPEAFGGVSTNGRFVLEQGLGRATPVDIRAGELALNSTITQIPPVDKRHRIPLIYPLNVPALGYLGFDGTPHEVVLKPDQVTLVNLWSTTCKPCLAELTEFAKRSNELKAANVRIIAISIDALESSEPSAVAEAKAMAGRLKIPFEVGMATPAVIEDFRRLHEILITLNRPMPMPSSFLINRQGELEIIYKGPVEVDTILADAGEAQMDALARYQRSAAFPGSMLDDEVINSAIVKNQAMVHYKLAQQLVANKMFDAAAKEYEVILRYWPDSGSIVNDLGAVLVMKGNITDATKHFKRAIELKPTDPEIRFNLARTLELQGKVNDATQLMEQSVSIFPQHANSHFFLGVLKNRVKDLPGAQTCFERAVELDSKNDRALFSLANMLLNAGEFANAKKHLVRALEISPNESAILVGLGKVYMYENNGPEAERLFRLAVRNQPQLAEAQYQLGLALAAQDKFSEAQLYFEATLRLDRNFPGAREALQQTMRNSVSKK